MFIAIFELYLYMKLIMKYFLIFTVLGIAVSGFSQTFKFENSSGKNLLIERSVVCEGDFSNAERINNVNNAFKDYCKSNSISYSNPVPDRIHFYVTSSDSSEGRIIYSVTSAYDMFSKNTSLFVQLVYLMGSSKRTDEEVMSIKGVVDKRFDGVMEGMKKVIKDSYEVKK